MINHKEKERLHGQLLVDFANARRSDEACFLLFESMQEIFEFSPQFAERAKKAFPSITAFKSSLTKQEIILLKLLVQEKYIMHLLADQFAKAGRGLTSYDCHREALIFQDIISQQWIEDTSQSEGNTWISTPAKIIEYSPKPYEEHINDIEDGIWEKLEPWTFNEVKKLMMVGNNILRLKARNSLSESKYSEIKDLFKVYDRLLSSHRTINNKREMLRDSLEDLINTKNLFESDTFHDSLFDYNLSCKSDLVINADGSVTQKPVFSEDSILETLKSPKDKRDRYAITITTVLSYYEVEFFRTPKNRKLIGRCGECEKYFVFNRLGKHKFCSDKCRFAFHNRRRVESGEAKEYKQRRKDEGTATPSYW